MIDSSGKGERVVEEAAEEGGLVQTIGLRPLLSCHPQLRACKKDKKGCGGGVEEAGGEGEGRGERWRVLKTTSGEDRPLWWCTLSSTRLCPVYHQSWGGRRAQASPLRSPLYWSLYPVSGRRLHCYLYRGVRIQWLLSNPGARSQYPSQKPGQCILQAPQGAPSHQGGRGEGILLQGAPHLQQATPKAHLGGRQDTWDRRHLHHEQPRGVASTGRGPGGCHQGATNQPPGRRRRGEEQGEVRRRRRRRRRGEGKEEVIPRPRRGEWGKVGKGKCRGGGGGRRKRSQFASAAHPVRTAEVALPTKCISTKLLFFFSSPPLLAEPTTLQSL